MKCKHIMQTVEYFIFSIIFQSKCWYKSFVTYANDRLLQYMPPGSSDDSIINITLVNDTSEQEIDIYELCFTKLDVNQFIRLTYQYDNETEYIICFDEQNRHNANFLEYEMVKNDLMTGILYAEDVNTNRDITALVKKYAGPNEDFYQSKGIQFKKEWLGIKGPIKIMNKLADEKIFKDNDIISI